MPGRIYPFNAPGPRHWSGTRDGEGHRTYRVKFRVKMDSQLEGPAVALQTPGLYLPGSFYLLNAFEIDPWAFCQPEATVSPVEAEGEDVITHFDVEQIFTTKPQSPDKQRCNTISIEDPLLEPPKISGSFVKYQEEATLDRYGQPLVYSSHEPIRGAQVEFDANRPSVRIEYNVPFLDLGLLASAVDALNDAPLWGVQKRCIKLSQAAWQRKYFGACFAYYTLTLDFDIRFDTFDREIADESNKVLAGEWDPDSGNWIPTLIDGADPDPTKASHYIRALDLNGNAIRIPLNGAGLPAGVLIGEGTSTANQAQPQAKIHVEKYIEGNLLLLGIPTTLN